MRRILIMLVLVVGLAGCSAANSWDYEGHPVDGGGAKTDRIKCFQVDRVDTIGGFWANHTHTYNQGLYCKTEEP